MRPFNGGRKILIFLVTAFVVCVPFTLAAFDCSDAAAVIENPQNNPSSILKILCPLQSAIWLGLYFAGAVLIILILYGGIKALMSTGDARQLEGAKLVWTYAVLGVVIILLAIFIIQVAFKLLGSSNNPLDLLSTIDTAFNEFLSCLQNPLGCLSP
jgi:hypothetical protein